MLRPLAVVVAVAATLVTGCPPSAPSKDEHDALCDEMLRCMFDDEEILQQAGQPQNADERNRYRGLSQGAEEIRTAFGPGGTCWKSPEDGGSKELREQCHRYCLCALGEACVDPAFRTALCDHDVRTCDDVDIASGALTFPDTKDDAPRKANYVAAAGEDLVCYGEPGKKSCTGDEQCGDDEACVDAQCAPTFVLEGGRCCHFEELERETVADKCNQTMSAKEKRCLWPEDSAAFCGDAPDTECP